MESSEERIEGAGRLGMLIMLASLAVLFLTSLLGYLYIRFTAPVWPPVGMPGFPSGLWVSTVVLLGSSFFVHRALRGARVGNQRLLQRGLLWTFVLGCLFLALQVLSYWELAQAHLQADTNLYGFTFYMLTGLHVAHVVGGLIPLGIVMQKAKRGVYGPENSDGVEYVAMYWHFLDAVWVVLFLALLFGS